MAILCDTLTELGHDVTLFASAESRNRAKLVPGRHRATRLDPDPLKCEIAAHLAMLHDVRERAADFDILHFHIDLLHFPLFEGIARRTVTTLHGRLDSKDLPGVFRRWPRYPLVSVSDAQRGPLPFANWHATVPHGLPAGLLRPPRAAGGGYLAFLGRLSPEKRPDRAIEIARRAGRRLRIAAKIDNADRRYFREVIEPMLADPLVELVGEIGDGDKAEFLGHAEALLFPIDWPEPFGLVMVEAMACGTPVIAWNCGSVPEVVDDGVTGFIVGTVDEAVAAVGRLPELDRRAVRRVFERRFSAQAMAAAYLGIYERALGRAPASAWQSGWKEDAQPAAVTWVPPGHGSAPPRWNSQPPGSVR